ncbi:MAG: PorV/PorQ family protein [Ignavibacteriae bacterium]|nr:PorV/PorQ family protein [Ignavibacteriota bacterium]
MKKYLKIILIVLTIILINNHAFAVSDITGASKGEFSKVGAAGAQFLKIGVGGRANGMAGAFVAVANDLTSLYWNPAGLADLKSISANFSFTQWFAGFDHSYGALSLPLGENFVSAVSITSFNSDKMTITTDERPEGAGQFTVSDVAIGASVAGYLTDQFSFGITFKYLSSSISNLSSGGIGFDVGTLYNTGIQGIKLGFAIQNLGTQQKYSGQDLQTTRKLFEDLNAAPLDVQYLSSSYSIPLIFRAGATTDIINEEDNKLLVSADFITTSDIPEQFAIGAEYTWNQLISIRGGYLIGQNQFGLSGGVGINYIGGGFKGQLDYSISPTVNIGLINRISIGLSLD